MKVIKNINNNVSLCLDGDGYEVVVFGSGVGFVKPPSEIPLEKIQRTFYDINPNYLNVISQLDGEILEISKDIIDYANIKLGHTYSSNAIFTLADHIQFAVYRHQKHIPIKLPLYYEVGSLYPKEMKIGVFALSLISSSLEITLPCEEAASIALHLVDYGLKELDISRNNEKTRIEKCTEIVEEVMGVHVDRKGFNYCRFVTHMYYLLDRIHEKKAILTENEKLFDTLIEDYPKTYECVLAIRKELNCRLQKEEILYLILHINRLCVREDCY